MDVQEKSKKRELIKTIAIIFLVIMLLLTFFSQTIMNHSLPEVATQVVQSGTINAKIRGSGTVAANESYEVVINQTREVRSVCVKTGDTVEPGTLLFVLGDMESQELQAAQEALQAAEIAYQKQILAFSKSYAEKDLSVKNIRLDLEKAIRDRDNNAVTDAEISYAKGDIAAAKNQVAQVERLIADMKSFQEDNTEYEDAKTKVSDAESKIKELESKVKELDTSIEGFREQLTELDTTGDVNHDKAVSQAENELRTAQSELSAAQSTLHSDYVAYRDTYAALISAVRSVYPGASESDRTQLKSYIEAYLAQAPEDTPGLADWQKAYNVLKADQDTIDTQQKTVSEKQTALQQARSDASDTSSTAEDKRRKIQDKISKAESEQSGVQSQIRDAQNQLQNAQSRLETATAAANQLKEQLKVYESSKRELDANVTELEEKLAELEEKQKTHKEALKTIEEKQQELESALSGSDISKQIDNLDLETQRLEIEKQRELVAKYQKDTVETEILSKVSGTVKSINVTAGKDTTAGEAMAVIDVIDRGFTIKISVTNEQAKQVKIGDSAEISNYFGGGDIQATLEAITSDPESGGQKRQLVFRVTGDIEAGTTINLSIGQRSSNAEAIVPKSALREDTNGHYVLVVTSKSTPLGNRYTAVRADVQVLAEDDKNAAVSGLAANDYVVTTASKPLDPGTQVRLVENPS